jgi:hypothetical protein
MFATKKQFFTKTSGYQISKSLRFRASATAYLNRTFGTPTNNKVWTWSAWVKRGSLSLADANHLFMASPQDVGSNPTTYTRLIFETDNTLTLQSNNSAGELFTSSAVYRDASAWYHIVLYMDAVNTTVRCYVNGTEISYASRTNPTNTNTAINASGNYHRMGLFRTAEPRCFDGYMAEVNFIDGQALTPSSFGAYDANGVWSPSKYTGTYGNNGFYLPFTDNSAATFSNLGADYSAGSYSSDLRSLGTNIGGMTTGGGLSSAFDGIYAQAVGSCAQTPAVSGLVTANSVGKDWGAGVTKTITAFRITAPTNEGFCSSGTARQIKLQGSTDNFSSSIVDLYSFTPAYKVADQQTITSGITTSTAYRYHRIVIDGNGTNSVLLAEVEFYESGSYGINNWMPNNISVTSGVTYDSMIDSPTNAASGTQPVGNYCVLNPIDKAAAASWTNGNLSYSQPTGVGGIKGTFGVSSGKWYWEVVPTANGQIIGVCPITVAGQTADFTTAQGAYGYYWTNGNKYVNGVSSAYGASYAANDVIGVALDLAALTITFYKNNVSQGAITGVPAGTYCAGITNAAGITTTGNINFGQQPFTYTPPSGYQALCTANLATPTIKNGAQYMAATTYTGTGATQTITNTVNSKSFQPDLVWIKSRSAATNHNLFDAIRGTTNYLISNSTAANASNVNTLTAFGSTGFTLGSDASSIGVNVNTATYVGWQWLAGSGTTSSNPNGSITSTVCVNTTAGFSIVTSASNVTTGGTLGHGLGVAPAMILLKNRAVVANWGVYHQSANASPASGGMYLNLTNAFTSSAGFWNSVAPTSTVFSIGSSFAGGGANDILAYCFAPITGYSAFGSYTGNGSTDGPFVYCGFKPRWIMVKGSTYASNWNIIDSSRTSYNADTAINLWLRANDATAAGDISGVNFSGAGLNGYVDFLSNGFKFRGAASDVNSNTNTLIYAAFAENPFNISRAR